MCIHIYLIDQCSSNFYLSFTSGDLIFSTKSVSQSLGGTSFLQLYRRAVRSGKIVFWLSTDLYTQEAEQGYYLLAIGQ